MIRLSRVQIIKAKLVLACCSILAPIYASGKEIHAFGVYEGTSVGNFVVEREILPRSYLVRSVPKPHPLLRRYIITIYADGIVCEVVGFSDRTKSKAVAYETLAKVHDQLTELHGDPKVLNGEQLYWLAGKAKYFAILHHEREGSNISVGIKFDDSRRCLPDIKPDRNPFR
jgi:hypothetical protein